MKKLLLLCSLFVGTSALVSCSSDDDSSSSTPTATSITLSADNTSIELSASVTFTVMNDLNEDVTSNSIYYVDGAPLSSNVFTPEASGTYTIHAESGSLVSNFVDVTVTATQQQNAVWYNELNYELTSSAMVLWEVYNPEDENGEPTHAIWSIVGHNGPDFVTAYSEGSSNFVMIDVITALDGEGNAVYPTTETILAMGIYDMTLGDSQIATIQTEQTDLSLTIGSEITDESTSLEFLFSALVEGTSADIDYDSVYEGLFVPSGGDGRISNGTRSANLIKANEGLVK